jgi:regulatory protein
VWFNSCVMPMPPDDFNDCFRVALRILSRRDHGCAELAQKLADRGYPADHIRAVVEKCSRLHYLNDERFAAGMVRELQRRAYGYLRIKQMLISKRLPGPVVEAALNTCSKETTQLQVCRQAMMKKLKSMRTSGAESKTAVKLYRFLLNRGFPAETIRQVMDEINIQAD